MTQAPRSKVDAALAEISEDLLTAGDSQPLVVETYRRLARSRFEGVAIRALATMPEHGMWPVLVVYGQSMERVREVPPADNMVLVVNAIDTNGLWVVPVAATNPDKIPMPKTPAKPAAPPAPGVVLPSASTMAKRLDLRALLGSTPLAAGRYALRMIDDDWVSNTVTFEVHAAGADADDRTLLGPDRRWDAKGRGLPTQLPNFNVLPQSPTLTEPGIVLRVPTAPLAANATTPVLGRVRLPRPMAWRERATGSAAVLHGHFVLTRRNALEPTLMPFDLPLFADPAQASSPLVDAPFAYDLNILPHAGLKRGGYQVYVVLDAFTAGPYPLQIQ